MQRVIKCNAKSDETQCKDWSNAMQRVMKRNAKSDETQCKE
jgi:hypothetical protein